MSGHQAQEVQEGLRIQSSGALWAVRIPGLGPLDRPAPLHTHTSSPA